MVLRGEKLEGLVFGGLRSVMNRRRRDERGYNVWKEEFSELGDGLDS